MYTEKQYNDFLDEIFGKEISKFNRNDFDIKAKEIIDYIKQNAKNISNEEWTSIIDNANDDILTEIVKNKDVPTLVACSAVKKECRSGMALVLLHRNDLPEEYIDKIYNNKYSHDTLHRDVCKAINNGTVFELPYAQNVLNYIGKKTLLGELDCKGRYEFGSLINDEEIIKEIIQDKSLTEWKVDWILKNPYISEELKDNIFDAIGFNYNDISGTFDHIKNPTPHMIDVLYRQILDTIDYVDNENFTIYSEKLNSSFLKSDANQRLYEFQRQGFLTDDMCMDLLIRKATSKDARISDTVIASILRTTKNEDIMTYGATLKSKDNMVIFENVNIPQHFIIDKFNEYLTKIKKELAKGRTHRVGGKIPKEWYKRLCRFVYYVPVSQEDTTALMKYYHNDYTIATYLSESKNITKEALSDLIKQCCDLTKESEKNRAFYLVLVGALVNFKCKLHEELQIPHNKIKLMAAFLKINISFQSKNQDLTDYEDMKFLYKDYEKFLFDKEMQDIIKEIIKDNKTPKEIVPVLEFSIKTMDYMDDMAKRDKEFNPPLNTHHHLFQTIEDIQYQIKSCFYVKQVYDIIDESMCKYYKAKEELENRGFRLEKEQEEISR